MIRKYLSRVLTAALLLSLTACNTVKPEITPTGEQATTFEGITVTVLSAERKEAETVLEVQWSNQTQFEAIYGEMFGLQRLKDGQWVDCEMKENMGFTAIGYALKAGETLTKFYKLEWAFGDLENGTYRFLTSCHVSVGEENKECKLSAEFVLGGREVYGSKSEFTAPPKLMIGNVGEAVTGTYNWSYALGDGTWSNVCADSQHPLQMEKELIVLSPGNAWVDLNFEVWPDEYSVRCWPGSDFGNPDASSQALMTWNNSIQLKTGGYIYEVTATWKDNGTGFYGTSTYIFYAAPAVLYDVMPIAATTDLYIAGEVLSLDADRTKIVSDILLTLTYEEDSTAHSEPEYKIELANGTSYGINLTEGYARCSDGQSKLSAQQVDELTKIIQWAEEITKAK